MLIDSSFKGLTKHYGAYELHDDVVTDGTVEVSLDARLNVFGSMTAGSVIAHSSLCVSKTLKVGDGGITIATKEGVIANEVDSEGPLYGVGSLLVRGNVTIGGMVDTSSSVVADGNIRVSGYARAASVIAGGSLTVKEFLEVFESSGTNGEIDVKDFITVGGSLNCESNIVAGGNIFAVDGLSSKGNLVSRDGKICCPNGHIFASGNISAHGIDSDGSITSGGSIDSFNGIRTREGCLQARSYIHSQKGIVVGHEITAGSFIDCGNRIFAGTSVHATCSNDKIFCTELRNGTVAFGTLEIKKFEK